VAEGIQILPRAGEGLDDEFATSSGTTTSPLQPESRRELGRDLHRTGERVLGDPEMTAGAMENAYRMAL
jgi:hypothetical protein